MGLVNCAASLCSCQPHMQALSVIGNAMLNSIYEENCSDCKRDLICHLCRDALCESCAVQVGGENCCRPCSVSIRNDESLVSYFVEWHRSAELGNIELSKPPTLLAHKYQKGSTFSVAEFEGEDILGSVTFRSDAQCDADAICISTEKEIFNEYRILVSETELDEFLKSVYANVQK